MSKEDSNTVKKPDNWDRDKNLLAALANLIIAGAGHCLVKKQYVRGVLFFIANAITAVIMLSSSFLCCPLFLITAAWSVFDAYNCEDLSEGS